MPILIIACVAANGELERRILARAAAGGDASEATLDVLHSQQQHNDAVGDEEEPFCVSIDTRQMNLDAATELVRNRLG